MLLHRPIEIVLGYKLPSISAMERSIQILHRFHFLGKVLPQSSVFSCVSQRFLWPVCSLSPTEMQVRGLDVHSNCTQLLFKILTEY